jgi:ribose transport system ATP-binding protein
MTDRAVLRLTDVVKTYPGVTALKGVSLEVLAGEVHAVVGENGAGKSTLMAVAAGATIPDSGEVSIGGQVMAEPTPTAAQALGLAVVYQHPSVLEDLSVAENMALSMPSGRRPPMGRAPAWARERLAVIGARIDPDARTGDLSVAEHQQLEIARALALEARVLILDEPTESLTAVETEALFERIAGLRATGTAIVYISHRLAEVRRVADRISVLRDGEGRGTFPAAEVTEADILRLIAGRSIDRVFPPRADPATLADRQPLLRVTGLAGHRFAGVDLVVRPGEIVGLAGVEGNGQRELLRALGGVARVTSGRIEVEGVPVATGDPRRVLGARLVHLPGDRHREGLFLSLSVRENVSLQALPQVSRGGVMARGGEAALARSQVERLSIRTPSVEAPVSALSGGNQQKVLIARAMLAQPRVLLADEPTRGVDVGARVEIYRILRDVANDGRAVVVLSSDAIELQGLCDRVLVFSRGSVVAELAGDAITEEAITGAAVTAVSARTAAAHAPGAGDRLRRLLAGDYAPAVILAIISVLLMAWAGSVNARFFTELNIQGMLLLASALVFVSLGQQVVLLMGGIDLSVGPLTGLVVICLSSFAVVDAGLWGVLLGLASGALLAALVGLANGFLVRTLRLVPVIATLATFIVLQGVALLLRPKPEGFIDRGFTDLLKTSLGPVPVAFVVAAATALVLEWALRRTRGGLAIRAVGSDEGRAHRMGVRVGRTTMLGYVLCSLLVAAGGVMLASQVGIGDATLGRSYTLTSITAVVLGGASIFGGRGSFVGALMGAFLIQLIVTTTSFVRLGSAWQYWLPGILVLVAAGLFSRARGIRAAALAGEEAA